MALALQEVDAPPASRRSPVRFLVLTVLGLLLAQRLALPAGGSGQVPLTAPLGLLALAVGLWRGHLAWDRQRVRLYVAAMTAAVVLTWVAAARGLAPSYLSLLFLLVLYAPAAVLTTATRDELDRVLTVFVRLMAAFAALGLVTFGLQFVGVPYRDWFAELVPGPLVQQGYVTSYPLFYLSPIYRSNGVLFLEASVYSLFLGLALLVGITQRVSRTALALLAGALVVSLSGNGVVVLLPGLVFLALSRSGRRQLARIALPGALAVVLAVLTPLGALLLDRVTEVRSERSSASLRLVQPYEVLLPAYLQDAPTVLLGNGPGAAGDYYDAEIRREGLLAPVLPKALYEFGGLGAALLLLFVLHVFLAGGRPEPWTLGLLFGYLLVNASLLQPTTALATVLFLSWLRVPGRR